MATLSPAQMTANRENARKSTGPKTAEGKAKTRGNAVTHGLSGQVIAPNAEDQALIERRIQTWSREIGVSGELEADLIGEAASAFVRMRRVDITECERAERRQARSLARRRAKARTDRQDAIDAVAAWDEAIRRFREDGYMDDDIEIGRAHV